MVKTRVSYEYLKGTNCNEVIKVEVPEGESYYPHYDGLAKKKAKLLGKELAGGCFSEDSKPSNFDSMIVYTIRKGTKPLLHKKDKRHAKPLFSWDETQIIDNEVKYQLDNWEEYKDTYEQFETKPDEDDLRKALYDDYFIFTDEWDNLIDYIGEYLNEKNPNGYWKVLMRNFGWRQINGIKFFKAMTGLELIREVLPDTDCTFYAYRYRNGLKIQNFHHDSPTGKEWYYLLPIAESTYQKHS